MTDASLTHRPTAGLFTHLFARLRAAQEARATRKALMRLTDRELDDIGLCRGDIDAIAYGEQLR